MNTNTKTAMLSRAEMERRFTAVITYRNGAEVYLDAFYKTETAARNAAIRARARLAAAGQEVTRIRTCVLQISVTGWSAPIKAGLYPTDFNGTRDGWLEGYFK